MNKSKDVDYPIPLMAFTFFYAVAIYYRILGFYFWCPSFGQKKDK